MQYIHLDDELMDISEIRVDRRQLIEEMSGKLLTIFTL
jgi:hypothetical protein